MYDVILITYRAPGLTLEHPECSRIFTEHGQKPISTVNTSACYRGRKLLRATPPTTDWIRL